MKYGTLVRINDLTSCDEKFALLKDNGFDSCQLVFKPKVYKKEDALIIKSSAEKYGIDISAIFCGYNDSATIWDNYYGFRTAGLNVEAYRARRVEYVKNAAEFASWVGTSDIIAHVGFIPNDPFDEKYTLMVVSVKQIADYCKDMKMNFLIETGTEAPIVLLRLIEDVGTGNVFINFDPANILMYGYGNPTDALRVFGKYVRNIHGKDGRLPTDTKNIGEETPIGEGMVNFPEIISILRELKYNRYIIIEREISGEQQFRDILKAAVYLKNLCTGF